MKYQTSFRNSPLSGHFWIKYTSLVEVFGPDMAMEPFCEIPEFTFLVPLMLAHDFGLPFIKTKKTFAHDHTPKSLLRLMQENMIEQIRICNMFYCKLITFSCFFLDIPSFDDQITLIAKYI